MGWMFHQAGYSATTWNIGDLSNWDTSNVTSMSSMFSSVGRSAAVVDIGTLNVYATSVIYMFHDANSMKATLNIHTNPTSYSEMFANAATNSGASIKVNYKSTVTNINKLINTKSSNSNVVKGSVIN